jgi:GT2 family glycosyltransferase
VRISVVVPNYNGVALLERYLPSVVISLEGDCEVVVVDDASTDGTVKALRERFPDVKVIARQSNGGFSVAANDGIRVSDGEFVVLLNNDVEVAPGLLDPIVCLFEEESVFAVSPKILVPSRGNLDEGAKTGFWHHGLFYTDQRQGIGRVTPILYTSGCAAVYRRSMLESLGGFDEAYSPFYWEDADLGYRAWKRGWKSLYQPARTVKHKHSATIGKMDARSTDRIKARNGLFFIWRNIEDEELMGRHRRWLPVVLARRALSRDWPFVRGYKDALAGKDEAQAALERDSAHRKLSDREIFSRVGIRY